MNLLAIIASGDRSTRAAWPRKRCVRPPCNKDTSSAWNWTARRS